MFVLLAFVFFACGLFDMFWGVCFFTRCLMCVVVVCYCFACLYYLLLLAFAVVVCGLFELFLGSVTFFVIVSALFCFRCIRFLCVCLRVCVVCGFVCFVLV